MRVGEIQVPSNFYTIRLQLGYGKTAIGDLSQENGHQTVLDKPSDMALAPKKTLKGSLNTPHNSIKKYASVILNSQCVHRELEGSLMVLMMNCDMKL